MNILQNVQRIQKVYSNSFAHSQVSETLFLTENRLFNLTLYEIKCAVTTILLDCVMETDTFCLTSCLYCQVSTMMSRPDLAGTYFIYTLEALRFHLWLFTSYVTS